MPIRIDPENNETRALFNLADISGKKVLEIGCGDGRLTWRYAAKAAEVVAIDPFEASIKRAMATMPSNLEDRVKIHHVSFEDFAAKTPPSEFDLVILSYALC